MANCREIEPKLAEYVEGEQPATERAAVDAHLHSCPPCRSRATGERVAHELICSRRDSLRGSAPGRLHERCAAQRATGSPPAAMLSRQPWVRFSVAASVVLASALFLVFGWGSSVETYAAQLSADHLKCFQFPPDEASAPDAAMLGHTWQVSNGWGLKLSPPSAPPIEGLTLLGVRRCSSSRGRVAHLLYRWHGDPLSVYVLNHRFDRRADAGQDHDVNRLGEHAIVWTEHDRTYAVVGDRRLPDLQRIATYVRHSIE
jgi:anti-sigma factor RsiW